MGEFLAGAKWGVWFVLAAIIPQDCGSSSTNGSLWIGSAKVVRLP